MGGKITCTLGEVKNRADFIVYWGGNPAECHPRHFTKYTLMQKGKFIPRGRADRTVVLAVRAHERPVALEQLVDLETTSTIDPGASRNVPHRTARGRGTPTARNRPDCANRAVVLLRSCSIPVRYGTRSTLPQSSRAGGMRSVIRWIVWLKAENLHHEQHSRVLR